MKTKKILTIIVLLGFSLTAMGMGLRDGTAGILPGADARQEKTEKKEEEKKEDKDKQKEEKDKKKIKRSWTDEDLKEIKKERVNITEVTPDTDKKKKEENVTTPPPPVTTTTKREKFDATKTEKYWRDRKNSLVERINNNKNEIKKLEQKLLELNLKRGGDDTFKDYLQLEQDIRDTNNKLEVYKKGLELMEKELEDLPEEARKAGVPPGWLRD